MKKRALRALLAAASLAAVQPAAAQDSRGVLAELAASEGAGRDQRLLEGARREGFLSLYTSFPPEDVAALNAAFEKKYGVKVRAWRAASEKVFQRTVAEAQAGRDEVDIV
ncbi:MAG TPA: ABC transporter substrate-binding protein, partial [Burkholderiales bacterium]|nr:ABC transporter substrate-binding protein [Burkholderiales bacterium]